MHPLRQDRRRGRRQGGPRGGKGGHEQRRLRAPERHPEGVRAVRGAEGDGEPRKDSGQRRREIRAASGDDLGEQGRAPGPRVPAASSCARAPAGSGAGRGYLAAKSPAANEPGAARAIFSSSDAGRLIAPAGSRQAAMETLGAAAERGSGPRGLPLVPLPPLRASAARLCARPAPPRTTAGTRAAASARCTRFIQRHLAEEGKRSASSHTACSRST